MRRRFQFLPILLGLFMSTVSRASDLPWQVDRMQVTMAIEPGDRLQVEEMIQFNLGHLRHHYLTRRIALVSPAGEGVVQRLSIRVRAITDGRGNPWPARVREADGWLEIRIGSGSTFLTSAQDVLLHYDVEGAIHHGPVRGELHWEVTGGPWEGPIIDLAVAIQLPPGAVPETIDGGGRTWRFGEAPRSADVKAIDPERARFLLPRGLQARERMAVSLSWPAELLPRPSLFARIGGALLRCPWWILPLAVLLVIGGRRIGRRLRPVRGTPISAAPGSPIEIGLLLDGELRSRHLAASVIDLARRRVLAIEPEVPSAGVGDGSGDAAPRFVFRRTDSPEKTAEASPAPALAEHEVLLLDALAPPAGAGGASDGDRALRVSDALRPITDAARARLERAGYLPSSSRLRRLRPAAIALGAALAVGALLALLSGAPFPAAALGIALAAASTALIVAALGIAGRRTRLGDQVRVWAGSLAAEAGEGAPIGGPGEGQQERFETLLPAAVAAGAGAAWIRHFAPAVRRPSYFPDSTLGRAAAAHGGLDAGRFFSEIVALAEPFRIATRARASSDC
jgi:Predicted membrane protein (DUF2207)